MTLGFDLRGNVRLAPLTTIGVGGAARWFVEAESEDQLLEAVDWARFQRIPVFVLGGGSNLLVSDAGYDGLVIHMALKGIGTVSGLDEAGNRVFQVAGGEDWDGFVDQAVGENCAGVECLAGIPGTVGGTPVQNVGAYGQEVSETIDRVRALDLEAMRFREIPGAECRFGYRVSLFNSTARGRYIVTRVDYRLRPGGEANLRYADLKKVFGAEANPALVDVAAAVRKIRHAKGMLLVEGDVDCRSAGSFFKNPVLTAEAFKALAGRLGTEPPHYPAEQGRVKLPAAWLIERAGFAKGFRLGRVGISSRHTLALVNLGGATATDVLALRDVIVSGVLANFGIQLVMEPVMVGF